MCEDQRPRPPVLTTAWERIDAQKTAIRDASEVAVWVYTRDGAHRVRINKTEARRLLWEAPDGWTVVCRNGRRITLEERGAVTDEPFRHD